MRQTKSIYDKREEVKTSIMRTLESAYKLGAVEVCIDPIHYLEQFGYKYLPEVSTILMELRHEGKIRLRNERLINDYYGSEIHRSVHFVKLSPKSWEKIVLTDKK